MVLDGLAGMNDTLNQSNEGQRRLQTEVNQLAQRIGTDAIQAKILFDEYDTTLQYPSKHIVAASRRPKCLSGVTEGVVSARRRLFKGKLP